MTGKGLAAKNIALAGRLEGVSATLELGRITAICGPNGAGKSTLLSVLAGLLVPERGAVEIDGEVLARLHPRERARRIGYLPQEPVIAWDVAVRNLVALGRLPHRDRGTAQVEAALQALDLASLADRPASQLSGGERARALLARVLAGEPGWILADEPLAALDLAHQLDFLRHLRRATEGGKGAVLVLHDLSLAMNHADRVLVLDRGRLVVDGAPQDALDRAVISKVWGVAGQWIGNQQAMAFAVEKG